jgi:hypothetical protein
VPCGIIKITRPKVLITTIVRRCFKVLFRPIESGVAGFLTKGSEGFAGLLSRKTDRWMMSDRESRAAPSRSDLGCMVGFTFGMR